MHYWHILENKALYRETEFSFLMNFKWAQKLNLSICKVSKSLRYSKVERNFVLDKFASKYLQGFQTIALLESWT